MNKDVYKDCTWLGAVALQNMLSLAENFISKVLARLAHKVLGISKLKCKWQLLTISMLLVLNIFIKKLLMTKSNDDKSDFPNVQGSKP